jgi:hypothetical protein
MKSKTPRRKATQSNQQTLDRLLDRHRRTLNAILDHPDCPPAVGRSLNACWLDVALKALATSDQQPTSAKEAPEALRNRAPFCWIDGLVGMALSDDDKFRARGLMALVHIVAGQEDSDLRGAVVVAVVTEVQDRDNYLNPQVEWAEYIDTSR